MKKYYYIIKAINHIGFISIISDSTSRLKADELIKRRHEKGADVVPNGRYIVDIYRNNERECCKAFCFNIDENGNVLTPTADVQ